MAIRKLALLSLAPIVVVVCAVMVLRSMRPESQTDIGDRLLLEANDECAEQFIKTSAAYYGYSSAEALELPARGVLTEEVPVVMAVAKSSGMKPAEVASLRQTGEAWFSILRRYNIDPAKLYLPLRTAPKQPPYRDIYSKFKSSTSAGGTSVSLSDDQVVDFVDLNFVALSQKVSPESVIDLRSQGYRFDEIVDAYSNHRSRAGLVFSEGDSRRSVSSAAAQDVSNGGRGESDVISILQVRQSPQTEEKNETPTAAYEKVQSKPIAVSSEQDKAAPSVAAPAAAPERTLSPQARPSRISAVRRAKPKVKRRPAVSRKRVHDCRLEFPC